MHWLLVSTVTTMISTMTTIHPELDQIRVVLAVNTGV
jgi:hypothetical protein